MRSFCEASNIDLIAVNETKLDSQIGDNEIQIYDYDIIWKDRNKFGSGVCLFKITQLEMIWGRNSLTM